MCTMSTILKLFLILMFCALSIRCQQALPDPPAITSNTVNGVLKAKSRLELFCNSASSSTSPAIWFLDGQIVRPRNNLDVVVNQTGALFTPSFKSIHSGTWQCSRDYLLSNKFVLSKARIKPFSRKLKDKTVEVIKGNTALIPCSPPSSRPRADTVFEFNGATIDESRDSYYLLSSGDLQIVNVQKEHNGAYRCVAINKVLGDKVSAPYTVTLIVKSQNEAQFAPQIVRWSLGDRVTAVEGDNLFLPCVSNANPPVSDINWERYLFPLPVNRTAQIGDSLVISDIQGRDSGTYNCILENEISTAPVVLTYVIDVHTRPEIAFVSQELHANEFTSHTFDCPLKEEPGEDTTVEWYYNGIKRSPNGTLEISNVTAIDSGIYQCIASNYVGDDSRYIKFYVVKPQSTTPPTTTTTTTTTPSTITTTTTTTASTSSVDSREYAYPPLSYPAPETPTVEQIRREGFRLSWSISSSADVLSYWVKMKEGKGNWSFVYRDLPKQSSSVEINSGLTAGLKYRFMIVALYRSVGQVESSPSVRVKLDPTFGDEEITPTTEPRPTMVASTAAGNQMMISPATPEVTVQSSRVVIIKWDPITGGVPVKYYKIQYKRVSDDPPSKWITSKGTIRETNEHEVANLKPGAAYKFRISAVYINDQTKSSDMTNRIKLSDEVIVPPQSPATIKRVWRSGLGQLTLSWVCNDIASVDQFIVQHKLSAQPGEQRDHPWVNLTVNVYSGLETQESSEATITGLLPDKLYFVRVLAKNSAGTIGPGNTKSYKVLEEPDTQVLVAGSADPGISEGTNKDEDYVAERGTKKGLSLGTDSDLLYVILGSVLGFMVLLLIVFVAICGFKQRQQRRASLAMTRGSQNKFADASKVLYGEQLKQQTTNGSSQFVTLNGGPSAPSNGTMSSVNSHRMSLNINPLNELDESYGNSASKETDYHQDYPAENPLDYNLMQHYPHYNSNGGRYDSGHAPSAPYPHSSHHNSHHSIDVGSHQEPAGSHHYSQSSLPHYNMHQQYERSRSNTPQFSTFLPKANRETSPVPAAEPVAPSKLPHPQGLRPAQYSHSPVPNTSNSPHGSQQHKRRKKRSERDQMASHSNPGSGREYNTNTDLSSGEGTGTEEYNHVLPPPPLLLSSYGQSSDAPHPPGIDYTESYPLNADTLDVNNDDRPYEEQV